ncbi:aminodeoxychorismate synthase component I [Aquabacterium sp. A7-Y]|uniref:aminodeoxychorismate synthase component I n=1 Tax=Aquabacterium sp. A7-Y TaxID=1349605 RepID=UPI00223CEC1E|nr:aminodeoxychorismate synthase component I [Aquabacterium sp. A7-Y]MCW7538172.1 aminodeoxychorismate synthase component I [Aquabacterium sp. A7-Y]
MSSLPSPPSALIDFTNPHGGAALRGCFEQPREVLVARQPGEVVPVVDAAWQQSLAGRWCVGYLRYEAAPAFEPRAEVHPAAGPLAWFAVFDRMLPWPALADSDPGYAPMDWRATIDAARFAQDIERIHAAIAAGEVYQVNHTTRLHSRFEGSPRALFEALRRAQPQGYLGWIDTGEGQLLSLSPELFFDWRDGRILSRPMKGTAPRGRTPGEDEAASRHLLSSEKERAENLMIVDLIRNDLSRIAEPFSVRVPRLFHTEAWPTVWQMTSDVEARTRAGVGLSEVFRALFPCGSVTGAPKLRAMHWIRALEDEPRGVYCGAVGVLSPGGAATFNVAIRTLELSPGGAAVCGVGSGITADATAEAEHREWRVKQRFLDRAARPFELLETLRLEQGQWQRLERHAARLQRAARHFGYRFDPVALHQATDDLQRVHPEGVWRVRLLLGPEGRVQAEAWPLAATPGRQRVRLAGRAIDAGSEFVRFKTTRREAYEALASSEPGVFDTLLWNEQGQLTEFTRGNVALRLDGRWLTPALSCGLLDGIVREELIEQGRITEAVLTPDDLERAEGLAFFNSLRGWIEVELQ